MRARARTRAVCVCVFVCLCVEPLESQGSRWFSKQGVQAVVSCPWTNEDGLTTGEARRDAFSCTCINKLLIDCCGPLVCFMVVHVPDVVAGGV